MRNVVVTGGSRGLGLGIARTLAGLGYSVVALARSESAPLVAAIGEAADVGAGAIHLRQYDLADLAGIGSLVGGIRKEFGPIHGLVNNAAIGTSGLLAMTLESEIEHTVRLNTVSPMLLTRNVVRRMMADRVGGRIVNITSIVSFTGFSGLAVYAATKASMVGFTRSLARELGPVGINVNAVAPGFVDTEMTGSFDEARRQQVLRRSPLHRLAEVEDIANAVEYLLGDKARNITGTVMTVDAGSTA